VKVSLRTLAILVIVMLPCLAITIPQALGTIYFGPNVHFGYGTGVYVSFTKSGTAASISRINGYWRFTDLNFNGVTSNMIWTNSGCNVTIASFDPSGWINYTVDGRGTQAFSVTRNPTRVYIDGIQASSGWTYSNDNSMMTISSATSTVALDFTPASISISYLISIITSSPVMLLFIVLALVLIMLAVTRVRRVKVAMSNAYKFLKRNRLGRVSLIILLSSLFAIATTQSVQYLESLQVESSTLSSSFTMANETIFFPPVQIDTNGPGYFESVGRIYAYFSSPYASVFNNFSVWMSLDNSSWTKVPLLPLQTDNRTKMGDLGLVGLDNFRIRIYVKYYFPPQTIYTPPNSPEVDIKGSFKGYIQIVKEPTRRDTINWLFLFFTFFAVIFEIITYVSPFKSQREGS